MPRTWLQDIVNNPAQVSNLANTKEDFEVMRGLWNGLYAYREWHDTHVVKRAKIIDLI
jgi:hypothetical protein